MAWISLHLFIPAHSMTSHQYPSHLPPSKLTMNFKLNILMIKLLQKFFTLAPVWQVPVWNPPWDESEPQEVNHYPLQLFFPWLTNDGKEMEVTYKTKLLGVIVTIQCRIEEHCDHITKKVKSRLHFLNRLKSFRANSTTLVEVYILFVWLILEYAAPVWHGMISKGVSKMLESVQRIAVNIILPDKSINYDQKITSLSLSYLKDRRFQITMKFALRMSADPKYEFLFPKKKSINTRSKDKFIEPSYLTSRAKRSPIVTFICILNNI